MREIPGSIPALAIQGLSLAHFNSINRYNHKQTILNEPQCSQDIVYPRLHTNRSILNDKLTITYPAKNSTEELLHPNIIKAALHVNHNQNCHVASEYYGWTRLYSGECCLIPLPFPHARRDKTWLILKDTETDYCWLQQFVQIQPLLMQPDPETHLSIFVILPYTTVTHDLSEVLAWSVSL